MTALGCQQITCAKGSITFHQELAVDENLVGRSGIRIVLIEQQFSLVN